jgi:hypothetical protein
MNLRLFKTKLKVLKCKSTNNKQPTQNKNVFHRMVCLLSGEYKQAGSSTTQVHQDHSNRNA